MKVSVLQEFLRSLAVPVSELGAAHKGLLDLEQAAKALDSFRDFDVEQFAGLLERAQEYQRSGHLPASSNAVDMHPVQQAAQNLTGVVDRLNGEQHADLNAVRHQFTEARRTLEEQLGQLAERFGVKATFKEDKNWLASTALKSQVQRETQAFRRLLAKITDPAAFQQEEVRAEMDRLAGLDDKVLKGVAQELGATAKGKGRKLVEDVVFKLTGMKEEAPKKPRQAAAKTDPAVVQDITQSLQAMADRAQDPEAVRDDEIDAILERVKTELKPAEIKAVAKEVTGQKVSGTEDALLELRAKLTETKRILESQRV